MYFDAGSPLAVVSENFMRISSLLRHSLRRLFENAISRYINRALWCFLDLPGFNTHRTATLMNKNTLIFYEKR